MGRKPSAAIQNPAGKRFMPIEVGNAVEPEAGDGGPTDKEGVLAAIAELADRTRQREWSPALKHVLISYRPGVQ
jgi:hypothetical protein